jgi:arylsulfatase A-like enzyme
LIAAPCGAADFEPRPPNLLVVTVDTLRPDRLSGYGYQRRTSPNIDRLMAEGLRFDRARTVVPLTCPALASMLTTLHPHQHGSTRNGIRIASGLPSLPKLLADAGYATSAVVSNWAVREELCGLGEHFQDWQEVLTRKVWVFGRREADADDVTDQALEWLERHDGEASGRPFMLWVHYMEPHSPYRLHSEYLSRLGFDDIAGAYPNVDRYDTEIAFVDERIGRLLEGLSRLHDPGSTAVLFTADHGESLGNHGYWGHGKHVYDASLRIPLSITWPGRIEAGEIGAPALITDVAPTLLSLADATEATLPSGFDWSPVIRGEREAPEDRVTFHQGHKGTVSADEDAALARRRGLTEVGLVRDSRKEALVVDKNRRRIFDLVGDPAELDNLTAAGSRPSAELLAWLEAVRQGLERSDALPEPEIDEQSREQLEALGYLE